jgi:hypothetical protein
VIPWVALLKHAPAIAVAADALLARARSGPSDSAHQNLDERLRRLEEGSREAAELLQDMARQINALTVAQAALARRVQVALAISIAAAALAAAAVVLAIAGS